MAIGSDRELFGKIKKRIKPNKNSKGGRPKVNRDLVIRLLKSTTPEGSPRYKLSQIARQAGCSRKTVQRIRDEALEEGLIETSDRSKPALGTVEAEFDAECTRATGYSFLEWVQNSTPKAGKYIFNFCEKVWRNIWDSCSLVDVTERNNPLGDQICIKFLQVFMEDKKRIRNRKKHIRYLFRYLNREDLCNKHLRMTDSRDPRPIRRVPEISMVDFPLKLKECWKYMEEKFPGLGEFIVQFKIATQMRTGEPKDERELWGIKKGPEHKSYLIMSNPNEYRLHVYAKRGEEWDITWLPKKLRVQLWDLYNQMLNGELLMKDMEVNKYRREWRKITTKVFGRNLTLHDMRKASITWFYVMGIPLEIATVLNVGWKDLNTPRDHYLEIRKLLKLSTLEKYRENIPEWFKEGLQEYIRESL